MFRRIRSRIFGRGRKVSKAVAALFAMLLVVVVVVMLVSKIAGAM